MGGWVSRAGGKNIHTRRVFFSSQNQEIKNLLHMYTRFTLRMLGLGGRVCYWAG